MLTTIQLIYLTNQFQELKLIVKTISHYSIYMTRSFRCFIPLPAAFLNLHHFLGPFTNCTDQPIYLRFGVVSMKSHSDPTLAFWNYWVFHREGTKLGEMQVKDKPITVSLPGRNGDNMG